MKKLLITILILLTVPFFAQAGFWSDAWNNFWGVEEDPQLGATVVYPSRGGTGTSTSDWTGYVYITSGVWGTTTVSSGVTEFSALDDVSLSSTSTGDVLYFDGSDWVNLGIGSADEVLKVSGGLPSWQTDETGASVGGQWSTTTYGIYYNSGDVVAGDTTTSSAPFWFDATNDDLYINDLTIGSLDGLLVASGGDVATIADNTTNWDSAYTGWNASNTNWDLAFNWATSSETLLDASSSNWDTAYSWGDWNGNIDISDDTNLATSTGILLTDDTLSVVPGEIDHDSLQNFASGEHFLMTAIDEVGTINTGTWEGDAIQDTYIASSAAYLADSDTQLSNEEVEDIVGAMATSNTETLITVTYQDGDGTIDFVVDNDLSNYDNSSSGFITASPFGAAIDASELASADFGSFTCNGTNCWLDDDSVTSSIIATGAVGDDAIDYTNVTLADFTDDINNATTGTALSDFSGSVTDAQVPDTITITDNATTGVTTLSSLVSIGTIGTGTWEGTAIDDSYIASSAAYLADSDTTYSATGTLLDLTSEVFSVNEGTLTDTKLCIYSSGTGLVCNTTDNSTNWDNTYTIVNSSSSNWDTAYSWGDHSTQNYLDDDVAGDVDSGDIANDNVDSQHYAADSIDNEHINWADIDNLGNEGLIADDVITPAMISVATTNDEYALTYEATGDTWEWAALSGGGDMLKADYDSDEDGLINATSGGTEADSSGWTGPAFVTAGSWGTSSIDISDYTNLVGGTGITLADDTLNLDNDFGSSISEDELASTDFGDFSCDGTDQGCSFDASTVQDNEIDYTAVTLADFTNDGDYATTGQLADGCTNCLNATEIEDIYLLIAGDSSAGNFTWTGNHDFSGGDIELNNDSVDDADINWGGLTDLNAGGEVAWGNIGEGEIANAAIISADIKNDTITHANIADADQTITGCFMYRESDGIDADDDIDSIWANKTSNNFTITEIWGESDQNVAFDLQIDDGSPADVSGTDINPNAGEAEDTSLAGDTTLAAGEELDLEITSVASTPTWLTVCWTGNWAD